MPSYTSKSIFLLIVSKFNYLCANLILFSPSTNNKIKFFIQSQPFKYLQGTKQEHRHYSQHSCGGSFTSFPSAASDTPRSTQRHPRIPNRKPNPPLPPRPNRTARPADKPLRPNSTPPCPESPPRLPCPPDPAGLPVSGDARSSLLRPAGTHRCSNRRDAQFAAAFWSAISRRGWICWTSRLLPFRICSWRSETY